MNPPKDLGIKVGSKEESRWTKVRDVAEESINNSNIEIEINREIFALAVRRIAEEKEKFK